MEEFAAQIDEQPTIGPVGGARIGLIDPLQFSRDCLTLALQLFFSDIVVVPFLSVQDCIRSGIVQLDGILLRSHDSGPFETAALLQVSQLVTEIPGVPVILISDSRSALRRDAIRNILRNGARGVIPSISTGLKTAIAVIHFVQAGGTFAPADVLFDGELDEGAKLHPLRAIGKFTSREMSVLRCLRRGKANKTIAHELGMAESTVKVHVRNIMRKLGATNRTQAAFHADQLWDLGNLPLADERHSNWTEDRIKGPFEQLDPVG